MAVVGANHSAGQAAVFLSTHAQRVYLILRGSRLGQGMSRYLSRRIETSGNIEVLYRTKIRRTVGEGGRLNGIEVEDAGRKQRRTLHVQAVFSLIGAVPHTAWLPSEIRTDQDGFIKTGRAVLEDRQGPARLAFEAPAVFTGDKPTGSICCRRPPRGLDETGGECGRRRRHGDGVHPPIPEWGMTRWLRSKPAAATYCTN